MRIMKPRSNRPITWTTSPTGGFTFAMVGDIARRVMGLMTCIENQNLHLLVLTSFHFLGPIEYLVKQHG